LDSGEGVFEAVLDADDVARCDVFTPSTGAVRLHLEAANTAQGSGVSALNSVELQVVDAAVVERVVPVSFLQKLPALLHCMAVTSPCI
jgi:hypothetical protein